SGGGGVPPTELRSIQPPTCRDVSGKFGGRGGGSHTSSANRITPQYREKSRKNGGRGEGHLLHAFTPLASMPTRLNTPQTTHSANRRCPPRSGRSRPCLPRGSPRTTRRGSRTRPARSRIRPR